MLPAISLAAMMAHLIPVPCVDVIFIKVVLVIDGDVAAVIPIAITPGTADPRAQRKSGRTPSQPHSRVITGITVGVIGISRRSVDYRGIVGRNVNDIGLSR